ncbi:hypothetical protein SpCBS45565_g01417 [Spizellomyces sp. 'palustris']|nr:hypothetical protein SpCBS45565_g01417 [Spizellomyces sp. 'palustris']
MSNQSWQRNLPGQQGQQQPGHQSQQPIQQQLQNALPFLSNQVGLGQPGNQRMNPLGALGNALAGAVNPLPNVMPTSAPAGAPSQANALHAMLQQLQQQQQQMQRPQSPATQQTATFGQQGHPAYGQQQAPPAAVQGSPYGASGPTATGLQPAAQTQAATNVQNLTPLQQAQLQHLQQMQQQQQLARLLVALLPNALQGGNLGVQSQQLPLGQALGVGQNAAMLNMTSAQQPGMSGTAGARSEGGVDDRRDRGARGDGDYRDRKRDYRDDSRDRKGRRDRSRERSPDRGRRRSDRRRDYRSDSDSDSSYYDSRYGSRRSSRERGRRSSPSSRRPGSPPSSDMQEGSLQTRHLWIGDLPPDTNETELRQVFERHGAISEIKLLPVKKGRSSCFLAYATKQSATKCMAAENVIRGRPTVCRINSRFLNVVEPDEHELKHKQAGFREQNAAQGYLHVRGLRHGISREDLMQEFHKFGKVVEVRKKPDSDQAIVEFESATDATKARNLVRATELWGPRAGVELLSFGADSQGSRFGGGPDGGPGQKAVHIVEKSGSAPHRQFGSSRGGDDASKPMQRNFREKRPQHETASLYLPMVPPDLDRGELARVCEPFGPIESLRIIPGRYTQHSMAFVNFFSIESAKRALEDLTGKYLFGMRDPMKVEFAQSTGARRRDNAGQTTETSRFSTNPRDVASHEPSQKTESPDAPAVVIRNFSQRLSGREISENLHKVLGTKFSGKKDIALFNIASLENCYAVVTPLNQWEAENTVRDLDNMEFFGSPLSAQVSTIRDAMSGASNDLNTANILVSMSEVHRIVPIVTYQPASEDILEKITYGVLHVTNLPPTITQNILTTEFGKISPVLFCELTIHDGIGAEAFLGFSTKDAAVSTRAQMNNTELEVPGFDERPVHVEYAETHTSLIRIRTRGHIPREELTRVFSRYGTIKNQLHVLDDLRSAFIQYDTVESGQRAVGGMRGETVGGFQDELAVDYYDSRVEAANAGGYQGAGLSSEGGQEVKAANGENWYEPGEDDDDGEVIMEGHVIPVMNPSEAPAVGMASEDEKPTTVNALEHTAHQPVGGMAMDMNYGQQPTPVASHETSFGGNVPSPSKSQAPAFPAPLPNLPNQNGNTLPIQSHDDSQAALQILNGSEPTAMEITPTESLPPTYSPSAFPPASHQIRIALKTKQVTVDVHLLSGNPSLFSSLPAPPDFIKLTQRFVIASSTIEEWEPMLTADKATQWSVGVALAAPGEDSSNFSWIVDYFASKETGGIAYMNGINVKILPPSAIANELLGKFTADASIAQKVSDGGKFLLMVLKYNLEQDQMH